MTTTVAPQAYAHMTRNELLDHINCLVMFDATGRDTDTAMGLMRWNRVNADELNARRLSTRRIYRPVAA